MIRIEKINNNKNPDSSFQENKKKRSVKQFRKIVRLMFEEEEENTKPAKISDTAVYDHYRNAISVPHEIPIVSYEELKAEYKQKKEYEKQYRDQKTGVCWYVRNDKTPYLTDAQARKFYCICQQSGVEPMKKFDEITGLIRLLDENTILYIKDNMLLIRNDKNMQICRRLKCFSYDLLMRVLERFPKTDDYMNEAYWEALSDAYHQNLEKQSIRCCI